MKTSGLATSKILAFVILARVLFALTIIALVFSTSCAKPAGTQGTQANVAQSPAPVVQPGAVVQSSGGGRVFRGLLGGKYAVQMTLRRGAGGELSGSYSYEGRGGELTLKGTVDARGKLTLNEYDGATQTGVFKGVWREKDYEPEVSIYGEWTKPSGGGEQSFYFSEQQYEPGRGFTSKEIKEENKKRRYTVEAVYPQIEGAEKFNRLVEGLVTKEVNDFRTDAGLEPGEKDYAPDAAGDSINIMYNVRLASDELVSVEFDVDYYEHGAAHPSHSFLVVNYDLKSGKQLELADLFKSGSNYLQKISTVAIEQVRKWNKDSAAESGENGPGEPYLNEEGIQEGAKPEPDNYQNWTLTRRGLVVTFDYYQLGPYAAGAQSVIVPYSELKEVIRPDGPLASLSK